MLLAQLFVMPLLLEAIQTANLSETLTSYQQQYTRQEHRAQRASQR
ncbi:MAG: hypothetical protein HC893_06815 [Chloroflexaceae bacterium]|nr:hypothetical protein [Chloroflexaceae bacterium]